MESLLEEFDAICRGASMKHKLSTKSPTRYFHDNPWMFCKGFPDIVLDQELPLERMSGHWSGEEAFPGFLLLSARVLTQATHPRKSGLLVSGIPRVFSFDKPKPDQPMRLKGYIIPCTRSEIADEFIKIDNEYHLILKAAALVIADDEGANPINDYIVLAFLTGLTDHLSLFCHEVDMIVGD